MNGLKERLNTAEVEIPVHCPGCSQFVGKDVTFYMNDDGSIACTRCYHDDRVAEIANWDEVPDWLLNLRDGYRRFRQVASIRGWRARRRELQSYAWLFFKDCWKNPREVQRRVAELRLLDRWQQRIMAGLDN